MMHGGRLDRDGHLVSAVLGAWSWEGGVRGSAVARSSGQHWVATSRTGVLVATATFTVNQRKDDAIIILKDGGNAHLVDERLHACRVADRLADVHERLRIMLMVIEEEWGGSVLPTATSFVPAAVRGEWGRWVGGCIRMGEVGLQRQKQQQPPPPPPVCRRCCSTCAGGCTQSPTTEETKPLQSPTIPPASCIRAGWVSATAITNGCSSRVQRHLAVPAAT